MKLSFFKKIGLVTVTMIGLNILKAPQATAAILVGDFQTAGDDLLTIDTDAGLEWLDLTQTAGFSPVQAIAQFSSAGFRWANRSEVSGLLNAFGLPGSVLDSEIPTSASSLLTNTQNFVNTLGEITRLEDTNLPGGRRLLGQITSTGFFDDGLLNNQQPFAQISYGFSRPPFSASPRVILALVRGSDTNRSIPAQGVYLVRSQDPTEVPTPVLMPGLVGMGIAALRKHKQNLHSDA